MIDYDISYDEFMLEINEEQDYRRLKESIRTKDGQLGDIERGRLIEHGRRIRIDEILKQNEISLKLKTEVQNLINL